MALLSVLDCAACAATGFGFLDMLQALKPGDYLGQSWYDDVIRSVQQSKHFPELAQAIGNFDVPFQVACQ